MLTPLRLDLGGPVGYSLSRVFCSLDTLISELHQTDVRRHDVIPQAFSGSVSVRTR